VFGYATGVQFLVAETAFEARLVPFVTGSEHLFGGIHTLRAFRALGLVLRGERHSGRIEGVWSLYGLGVSH